jgi:hypothetical protein
MSGTWLILIVVAIMLVIGVTFALIWWHMADVVYPGTDQKTGQRIFKKRGAQRNEGAVVVKGFESPPPSPPPEQKPG